MQLTLTQCQADILQAIFNIFEQRKQEPPNKRTSVSIYSIKNLTDKEPRTIKIALQNINTQLQNLK